MGDGVHHRGSVSVRVAEGAAGVSLPQDASLVDELNGGGAGRRVNASVSAFARSLALLHTTREEMIALDPVMAGRAVADFQDQLVAIDASALDDPRN